MGNLTLMSTTGVPPGVTKNCKAGCVDNRVLLVDRDGSIVWQYGQFGVTGFGPNQLNTPAQNTFLPNGNVLTSWATTPASRRRFERGRLGVGSSLK